MREVDLEARMREILTQMTVISEVDSSRLGDIVHGGEHAHAPKGPRSSMAEYHWRCWRRAKGAVARQEALEAAKVALSNARYAPRLNDPLKGTLEWRLMVARDPRRAEDVAQAYGVSEAHVYHLRKVSRGTGRQAA